MAQNITLQFVEEKDLENLENVKLLFTEYSNSLNLITQQSVKLYFQQST